MIDVTPDFVLLERIVGARRSVRAFRPGPVPDELLGRALALAQQAPSNCNTQPWTVHIVSGVAAERTRAALLQAAADGPARPDFPFGAPYAGVHRERQIGAARALYGALGIDREDLAGRRAAALDNYRFFGAPHAAFLFVDAGMSARETWDAAMFAQTLMLGLAALGIGTCAQGALAHYPDAVRDVLGLPPALRLLFGIAIGWPDEAHPTARALTARAPVADCVTFHR